MKRLALAVFVLTFPAWALADTPEEGLAAIVAAHNGRAACADEKTMVDTYGARGDITLDQYQIAYRQVHDCYAIREVQLGKAASIADTVSAYLADKDYRMSRYWAIQAFVDRLGGNLVSGPAAWDQALAFMDETATGADPPAVIVGQIISALIAGALPHAPTDAAKLNLVVAGIARQNKYIDVDSGAIGVALTALLRTQADLYVSTTDYASAAGACKSVLVQSAKLGKVVSVRDYCDKLAALAAAGRIPWHDALNTDAVTVTKTLYQAFMALPVADYPEVNSILVAKIAEAFKQSELGMATATEWLNHNAAGKSPETSPLYGYE